MIYDRTISLSAATEYSGTNKGENGIDRQTGVYREECTVI